MAKRKRQAFIPGTEPPSIPEIDEAADVYVELRDNRMGQQKDEAEALEKLTALMHQNSVTTYEYDGKTVTLEALEKVRVRRNKSGKDNGDDDA